MNACSFPFCQLNTVFSVFHCTKVLQTIVHVSQGNTLPPLEDNALWGAPFFKQWCSYFNIEEISDELIIGQVSHTENYRGKTILLLGLETILLCVFSEWNQAVFRKPIFIFILSITTVTKRWIENIFLSVFIHLGQPCLSCRDIRLSDF